MLCMQVFALWTNNVCPWPSLHNWNPIQSNPGTVTACITAETSKHGPILTDALNYQVARCRLQWYSIRANESTWNR